MGERGGSGLSPSTTDDNHAEILRQARDEVQRFRDIREQNNGKDPVPESIGSFSFADMGISSLPEELVDIIKDEAQRLALNRNMLTGLSGLSPRIGEFSKLKYLVARHNMLREFPRTILSVETLEFLDLRNNQLEALPEDLSKLSNLKIFSVKSNNIKRLPLCIAQMHSLQSLVIRHNPVEFPPKEEWRKQNARSSELDDDQNRDVLETKELKKVLGEYAKRTRSRTPGFDGGSEPFVETPRPIRRQTGIRFPIRPSVSNVDIHASVTPASPAPRVTPTIAMTKNGPRFPPVPASAAFRPSLNPLGIGNERSRSSSESQMSTSRRKKRMGMQMSRGSKGSDQSELENLAAEANRLSHNRGVSHGVRLETSDNQNGLVPSPRPRSPVTTKSSESASKTRTMSEISQTMSDTSEHRTSLFKDPLVDLADSIIFAFDQYQPHYRYAVGILRNADAAPVGLDATFRTAMNALEQLQRALLTLEHVQDGYPLVVPALGKSIVLRLRHPIVEAIQAFDSVGQHITANLETFVKSADARRVRTFTLGIYAGNVEKTNALNSFYNRTGILIHQLSQGVESYKEIYPGQDYEDIYGYGQDTDIRRRVSPSPRPRTSLLIPKERELMLTSVPMGSNSSLGVQNSEAPSTEPLIPALNGINYDTRWYTSEKPLTAFVQKSNAPNPEDEKLFIEITRTLNKACNDFLEASSFCKEYYAGLNAKVRDLQVIDPDTFSRLELKRISAEDAARNLKQRLDTIDFHDVVFRDDPDLWQRVFKFFSTFRSFGTRIRRNSQKYTGISFAPSDIRMGMKPVSKSIRLLEDNIKSSPWSNFDQIPSSEEYLPLSMMRSHPARSPPTLGIQTSNTRTFQGSHGSMSASSTDGAANFGFDAPLPATPISASLGPSAPSTTSGVFQPPNGVISHTSSMDRSRSVSSRH